MNGVFSTASLERLMTKIVEVRVADVAVSFSQDFDGSVEYIIDDTTATTVDVIYQFVPDALVNTFDVPEVPEQYHDCIVNYVVACERAGGDINTQGAASVDFQLFLEEVRSIIPATRRTKFTHFYN